eukprot:Phypoly_transcript_11635.p1 GENE.Phypoly_transcript_11635~~Phypoly_transcript_11635.p1  ORF type:complete len:310 (+),score=31.08 Phypoly_transcript_11635:116-1045(+)
MFGSGYIRTFREANNLISLRGRNVLVVGGTAGIGAAAAVKFAQMGASVTIAGRNQQNGADMVAKMESVAPNKTEAQFHYMPVDITLMADVKRFTNEYMQLNKEGLSTLIVTSGGLNTGPRRDTAEGIEHNFALSYLGRFLVINRLIPLLLKAPEGGRAMSVLSAGAMPGTMDLTDIEMKKPGSYAKLQSAKSNSVCNDAMVEEMAIRYKDQNASFFHLSPGAVATDIMHNSNVPLASVITFLMKAFITRPEDYAEVLAHIATAPEFGPGHSGSLDSKANRTNQYDFLKTPAHREAIWNYSVEVSGLNKD